MSISTSTATRLATEAASGVKRAGKHDVVEYPERRSIAQSVWHGVAVRLATTALDNFFRDREDVLVAMELTVYYERGNNNVWLRPDLQVVFGVGRDRNYSTYKVWEEGKGPDFVLEVVSPSTAERDATHKALRYLQMGVREYWRLDPKGSLMAAPLEGYASTGRRFKRVKALERPGRGTYLASGVLGLDLRTRKRGGATVLIFADPRTGREFDGAPEEAERQLRNAEGRFNAERGRANALQDQVNALQDREKALQDRVNALQDREKALQDREKALQDRVNALQDQVNAERDRANALQDEVRALKERLRLLEGRTRPSG